MLHLLWDIANYGSNFRPRQGVPLFNALVWGGANPFIGIGKYGLQKLETFLYGMVQSAFRYLEPLTRDSRSALPPTFNGNFFVQEYFCVKIFHENPITLSGDMSQIVEIAISRNGTKISYSEYTIFGQISDVGVHKVFLAVAYLYLRHQP